MTATVTSILSEQRRHFESGHDANLETLLELQREDQELTAECVKRIRVLRTLQAYINDGFLQFTGSADMDWDANEEGGLIRRLDAELRERLNDLALLRDRIRKLSALQDCWQAELALCTCAETALLV